MHVENHAHKRADMYVENKYIYLHLTILTGKRCVLLNSVQRMAGWLLLIFFICLHNKLSSIHSIITY